MGEARTKSRSRQQVLAGEKRCIYCDYSDKQQITIEHMPPIQMFQGNLRLSGMEFAGCPACNNGSRGADTVASFVSRLKPFAQASDWEFDEARRRLSLMKMHAPGVLAELFPDRGSWIEWRRNEAGIAVPTRAAFAGGPRIHAYLTAFASKLGMALFREHVGVPLPLEGKVFSQWYLNSGLSQRTADAILNMLPNHDTLRQGTKNMLGQFEYRFNTDQQTTVGALSRFHRGLYTFTIATTLHAGMGFFQHPLMTGGQTDAITRPGDLKTLIPREGGVFSLSEKDRVQESSDAIR